MLKYAQLPVGVRSSYQLALLGAGGETSQAGPPRHHCIEPSVFPRVRHTYTMAPSFAHCLLNDPKSPVCVLLCQMGTPADTTPIIRSTSSLAPGSLPRLGHPVSAGFRPQGSLRYCHSPDVNVCLKSQGRQNHQRGHLFLLPARRQSHTLIQPD